MKEYSSQKFMFLSTDHKVSLDNQLEYRHFHWKCPFLIVVIVPPEVTLTDDLKWIMDRKVSLHSLTI